ncbi:hypothetical protein [Actinophytocola oryzae]|uniref:Uncharacterized protein n=1 Tax=Actinophytocola oryzae TaxID=502181 RepID=A0A4R7V018_9PSEU|nr:hypothetical protein [Actinophytocola oryzae]TDV42588.1 hypothetical protein CLV71_11758 [Actinophytocola oryzae]
MSALVAITNVPVSGFVPLAHHLPLFVGVGPTCLTANGGCVGTPTKPPEPGSMEPIRPHPPEPVGLAPH